MAKPTEKNVSNRCREDESICPVCHDRMDIFAVGSCDHPVCLRCATRMRVLCSLNYCPICRTDLQKVLLVRGRQAFDSIQTKAFCINREFMMFFEDQDIYQRYNELLKHQCKICTTENEFKSFKDLRMHMQRQHQLFFCDLCVDNIKLFSVDRKYYNRTALVKHRKHGDDDDRSYRGHPQCEFCDVRFFDNDELLRHLRKQHYYCHFCEADGVSNEYFCDYPLLKEHFRSQHILCEEGECKDIEFENAFRSDIDYRSHWAQKHSSGAGRQLTKQMKTIHLDFGDSQRMNRLRGGATGGARSAEARETQRRRQDRPDSATKQARERQDADRKRREEIDQAHALTASLASAQKQGHISVIDPYLAQHPALSSSNATEQVALTRYDGRPEDFPTLDGSSSVACTQRPAAERSQKACEEDRLEQVELPATDLSDTLARKLALASRQSVRSGTLCDSDFPSLPGGSHGRKAVANSWVPSSKSGKKHPVKQPAKSAWTSVGVRGADDVQEEFPELTVADSSGARLASLPSNNSFSSLSDISKSFSSGNLELMATSLSWGPELNRSAKGESKAEVSDNFLRLHSKHKTKNHVASKPKLETKCETKRPERSAENVTENSKKQLEVQTNNMIESGDKVLGEETLLNKNSTKRRAKGAKGVQNDDTASGAKNSCPDESGDVDGGYNGKFSVLGNNPEKSEKKQKSSAPSKQQASDSQQLGNKHAKKNGKKQVAEGEKTSKKKHEHKTLGDIAKAVESGSLAAVETTDSCSAADDIDSRAGAAAKCEVEAVSPLVSACDDAETVNQNATVVFRADDFPSLPVVGPSSQFGRLPSELSVVKGNSRSTLTTLDNVPASTAPVSSSAVVANLSALAVAQSAAGAPPPPGFTAAPKPPPPPGFGSAATVVGKLPPGFTGLSAGSSQTFNDDEGRTTDFTPLTKSPDVKYIVPRDASDRAVRLFQAAVAAVGSENMASFQEVSSDFRSGKVSAADYHERCRKILGQENFSAIFPELVVLLSDIPKQHQLLEVHRKQMSSSRTYGKNKAWSSMPCDDLTQCVVCGQVLLMTDRQDHDVAHNVDREFPSLLNSATCTVR